jgi:hypothetical protein
VRFSVVEIKCDELSICGVDVVPESVLRLKVQCQGIRKYNKG